MLPQFCVGATGIPVNSTEETGQGLCTVMYTNNLTLDQVRAMITLLENNTGVLPFPVHDVMYDLADIIPDSTVEMDVNLQEYGANHFCDEYADFDFTFHVKGDDGMWLEFIYRRNEEGNIDALFNFLA